MADYSHVAPEGHSLAAWEPTLQDKINAKTAEVFKWMGLSDNMARKTSDRVVGTSWDNPAVPMALGDVIPGLSTVFDIQDGTRALSQGRKLDAAMDFLGPAADLTGAGIALKNPAVRQGVKQGASSLGDALADFGRSTDGHIPLGKEVQNPPPIYDMEADGTPVNYDGKEMADVVLSLLRQGRGREVTDDLYALTDKAYLRANYDLPMDPKSIAERAQKQGYPINVMNTRRYTGTKAQEAELQNVRDWLAQINDGSIKRLEAGKDAYGWKYHPLKRSIRIDAMDAAERMVANGELPRHMVPAKVEEFEKTIGADYDIPSLQEFLESGGYTERAEDVLAHGEAIKKYRAVEAGMYEDAATLKGETKYHGFRGTDGDPLYGRGGREVDGISEFKGPGFRAGIKRPDDSGFLHSNHMVYLAENPDFASAWASKLFGEKGQMNLNDAYDAFMDHGEPLPDWAEDSFSEGAQILPVVTRAENTWDPADPEHFERIANALKMDLEGGPKYGEALQTLKDAHKYGQWEDIENPRVLTAMQKAGFDSHMVSEDPIGYAAENLNQTGSMPESMNIGVIDPSKIRAMSAIFDPRLSHLRNLGAGVAGPALGLPALLAGDQEPQY